MYQAPGRALWTVPALISGQARGMQQGDHHGRTHRSRPPRGGVSRPRVAAALAAAALMAALSASLTGAARQPITLYPVQAAFASAGPYATTTGTVTDSVGTVIYDVFRPSDYSALGFASPVVTWGNGTGAARPRCRTS